MSAVVGPFARVEAEVLACELHLGVPLVDDPVLPWGPCAVVSGNRYPSVSSDFNVRGESPNSHVDLSPVLELPADNVQALPGVVVGVELHGLVRWRRVPVLGGWRGRGGLPVACNSKIPLW